MEPLSSKVLNDQIIYLRKEVKRALVHQIHHLTTAAKRLRSKKGTNELKEKNASKANNMYSEIKILKKLKPDEISLFALTNFKEEDLKMFVSKQIIAPQTKAKAKLCLRKNLRSAVDQFIARHPEETDLLNKLLEARYSCQENKINKKKKKKQKEIESGNLVEQNHLSPEHTPFENMVPDLSLGSDDDNESLDLLNNIKRKEMPSISKETGNNLSTEDTSDNMVPELPESDSDSINESLDLLNSNKIKKKRVNTTNFCSIPATTIKKTKETQSISEEIKTKASESDVHCQDKTEAKHVNPFFVNRDSSKYYTYRSIEVNSQKEKEDEHVGSSFQKDFKKNFTDIRKKRNNDFSNKSNQHQKFVNTKSIKYLGGKNERISNKKDWTNSRKNLPRENAPKNVKLHPSWEAKKKMAISSVPFQGKKIKFDDLLQ